MNKKDQRLSKFYKVKASSIDKENSRVTFVISDGKPDRHGEIVDQKSWQTDTYASNPIMLFGHDPSQLENVLGKADMSTWHYDEASDATELTFNMSKSNPKAQMAFGMIEEGSISTVSVGFICHTFEYEEDVPVLRDNELLEVSLVPIPANPRAVVRSFQDGRINAKDAKFMVETMRAEAELLQKELDNDTKEPVMDEIKTLLQTLNENVLASKAATEENTAAVKALQETTEKSLVTKDADADADADVDEDKDADADADADDLAKDGDNDQSGAGDADADADSDDDKDKSADLTEESELTEEQQKEFEAELAKALAA